MKNACGLSVGNWLALLGLCVTLLIFVNSIVDRKVDEINVRFDRVEKTIDRVDTNVNEHLKYHISNKGNVNCQSTEKEVSYAKAESRTSEKVPEVCSESTR